MRLIWAGRRGSVTFGFDTARLSSVWVEHRSSIATLDGLSVSWGLGLGAGLIRHQSHPHLPVVERRLVLVAAVRGHESLGYVVDLDRDLVFQTYPDDQLIVFDDINLRDNPRLTSRPMTAFDRLLAIEGLDLTGARPITIPTPPRASRSVDIATLRACVVCN